MKESEKTITKIIKIKDIMRLFFKYDMDFLPVIDRHKKLKGLLDKKLIIQDATDTVFIEKPFPRMINKFMFYPEEEFFLQIVSNLPDELKFPVVDSKGAFQHLWLKKDLLNSYYNIDPRSRSGTQKKELDYKELFDELPFNMLLIDSKNKILNANKNFLNELDFEQDILFNQNITKFFPRIITSGEKHVLYPKVHAIKYRHEDWYYTIFNINGHNVYLFHRHYELLNPDIEQDHGQDRSDHFSPARETSKKATPESLTDMMENKESQLIKKALEDNEWNISQASQALNIPRQTLQYKISKYKIS